MSEMSFTAFRSLRLRIRFLIGLLLVIFSQIFVLAQPVVAASSIPHVFNYQGRLLTPAGLNAPDGIYSIKFSLYDSSSGGNRLYTSAGTTTTPSAISVTVSNGLFSVLIGDTGQNPLSLDWNQDSLYLGVTVNTDSEMMPRKRLSAVPFAFNAETLQGNYASSGVATAGGALMTLNQTSSTAATADRTALLIETAGTSNQYDYLLKGTSTSTGDVFTVSRLGNTTTTGNLAVLGNTILGNNSTDVITVNGWLTFANGTSTSWFGFATASGTTVNALSGTIDSLSAPSLSFTNGTSTGWLGFATASGTTVNASSISVNGSSVCLANGTNCPGIAQTTSTLQQITNNGATTTNELYLQGGLLAASSTFTGPITSISTSTFRGVIESSGGTRISGLGTFTSGGGVEMAYNGTNGQFTVYDRSASVYKSLIINALNQQFYANGTERMRLDNNGDLGLWTSNPSSTLDVIGSGRFTGTVTSTGLSFVNGTSTTWFDFATATGTTLNANTANLGTVAASSLTVGGQSVCLVNGTNCPGIAQTTSTLQQITNNGATTTNQIYLFNDPSASSTAIARKYVESREQNLLTNGSGLMGDNYNFTTFAYSQNEVHGGMGSFLLNVANGVAQSDELIPVDPTKNYRLVAWGKSGETGGANYDASNRQYLGIAPYDIDGNVVLPQFYMKSTGSTDTTLAKALNPGDTTMTLTDATGWQNAGAGFNRNILWYGYTNSKGYTYPNYTYTRNASSNLSDFGTNGLWATSGISGNVITLRAPWPGPALATSTAVRNETSGGTFKYIAAANVIVPNDWTRYEGYIGGYDTTGSGATNLFPYGTAYIKVLFLINYHGLADNDIRWSDLWLSEMSANNLEVASSTAVGVVSLGNQTLGAGDKYFTGSVGIGTTNPAGSFQVAGTNGAIFGAATGSPGTVALTTSASSPVSGRMTFGTDGTGWQFRIAKNTLGAISDLLTVQDNGEIGIGTTNASTTLDVIGGGRFTGTVTSTGLSFVNGTSTTWFDFATATGTTLNANTANLGTTAASSLTVGGQSVCLANGTNCPGIAQTTSTLQQITNNGATTTNEVYLEGGFLAASSTVTSNFTVLGHMGIGTSSTGANLQIGTSFQTPELRLSGDSGIANADIAKISFERSVYNSGQNAAEIVFGRSGGGSEGNIRFKTQSSAGSLAEAMRIDEYGNVGIGTSGPAYRLDVTGGGRFTGTVTSTGLSFVNGTSTTWFNFATATGSTLNASTANLGTTAASTLTVGGQTVCLANGTNCPGVAASTSTLQQITNNGATTTNEVYLQGGLLVASSTFTSGLVSVSTSTFSGKVGIGGAANQSYSLDVTGNGLFSGGLTLGNSSPTILQGSRAATVGSQIIVAQNYAPTVGSIFSSGNAFLSSNAYQTTDSVDAWQKGTGTFSSNIVKLGISTGNNGPAFQLLNSPPNASGTYANTFTNPLLTVLENGSVGIGTVAPNENLDIATTSTAALRVYTTDAGTSTASLLLQSGRQWALIAQPGNALQASAFTIKDQSASLERLRIDANGNVGIRTSNPSSTLDVLGTGRFSGALTVTGQSVCLANGTNCPGTAQSTSTLQQITNNGATTTNEVYLQGGYLAASSTVTSNFAVTGQSTLATSTFTGNVGIGAPNPNYKLGLYSSTSGTSIDGLTVTVNDSGAGISHTSKFFTQQEGNGVGRTLFYAASPDTTTGSGEFDVVTEGGGKFLTQSSYVSGSGGKLDIYNTSAAGISLNTYGNSYFTGGNLGINTTSPSSALDVSGSGRFTGTVTSTGLSFVNGTSTTWFDFATATGTTLNANTANLGTVAASSLTVGGQSVCLVNGTNCPGIAQTTSTLQQITNNGATTTNEVYLQGGLLAASSTFTSGLNSVSTSTFYGAIESSGGTRISGAGTFTSGGGVEMAYNGTNGQFTVYDRSASVYKSLIINALNQQFYADGTERMRLDSNGDLGLWTSNPSSTLDVIGSGRFTGTVTSTGLSFVNGTSTTWFDFATATGTTLNANTANLGTVAASSLTVGGQSVCLVNGTNCPGIAQTTSTLQQITNNGATTTNEVYLEGGFLAASSTVTSTFTALGNIQNTPVVGQTFSVAATANISAVGSGPTKVAVAGKYAYVTYSGGTLGVIDVSNPTSPSVIGSVYVGTGANGVAVSGRYVYTSASSSNFFDSVDVSDPSAPFVTATSSPGACSPMGMVASGRGLYVECNAVPWFAILDVSNPTAFGNNPTVVTVGGSPLDLAVGGRYAYVANYGSSTVSVVDAGNFTTPVLIGSVNVGSGPAGIAAQGRYVYTANKGGNSISVIDVSNPATPSVVATLSGVGTPSAIAVSGRYLVTTDSATNKLYVTDVAIPTSPVVIGSVSVGSSPTGVAISGRYLYVTNQASNSLSVVDIGGIETSGLKAASADIGSLVVDGYGNFADQLTVNGGLNVGVRGANIAGSLSVSATNTTSTFIADVKANGFSASYVTSTNLYVTTGNLTNGTVTSLAFTNASGSVLNANTSAMGTLTASTFSTAAATITGGTINGTAIGNLSPAGGTFTFVNATTLAAGSATSSWLGFTTASGTTVNALSGNINTLTSNAITVNGSSVCLANGTNCLVPPSQWQDNGTNGTVSLVTSTRDVLLGGSTTATAGFIWNYDVNGTSSLMLGAATNTNLYVGTSTYGGGLDPNFGMGGNDVIVQGQLGAIGGLFSATSVVVGTGSTYYGDGNLYKTTAGDFTFALNNAGSSFKFNTGAGSVPSFMVTSSSQVGIGVASTTATLTVAGNVDNLMSGNQAFSVVTTSNIGATSWIYSTAVQGKYVYTLENSNPARLRISDVSNPSSPILKSTLSLTAGTGEAMKVQGRYAYVSVASSLYVVDISNPSAPMNVATSSFGAFVYGMTVSGGYVYGVTGSNLVIMDVSSSTAPYVASTISLGGSGYDVFIQGNYAYVAGNSTSNLLIFNISNPHLPVQVGSVSLGASTNPTGVVVSGRYAYVANNGSGNVSVVDVSNPASPNIVNAFFATYPSKLAISGRYLYATNGSVTAYDVSSSTSVLSVGSAYDAAYSLAISGHNIYTGNTDGTLGIINTKAGIESSSITAGDAELGNLNVLSNATIGNLNTIGSFSVGGNSSLAGELTVLGNSRLQATDIGKDLTVEGHIENVYNATDTFSVVTTTSITGYPTDYVKVQGNYLYLNTNASLVGGGIPVAAYDISDPANPKNIGLVADNNGFDVSGKYIVDSCGWVTDISNPSSPAWLYGGSGVLCLPGSGTYIGSKVHVVGNVAYGVDASNHVINVLNVSNPRSPVLINSQSIGFSGALTTYDIDVKGKYLYAVKSGAGTNVTFFIFDISTPLYPQTVYSGTLPITPNAIDVEGRYAYISGTTGTVAIVDVSNKAAPTTVSQLVTGQSNSDNILVDGRYAYIADIGATTGTAAVAVLDVSSSTHPYVVKNAISGLTAVRGIARAGQYLYVTSYNSLSVVDMNGTEVSGLTAHTADIGDLQVRKDAYVGGDFTVSGGMYVGDNGLYSEGGLTSHAAALQLGGLSQINTTDTEDFEHPGSLPTWNGWSTGGNALWVQTTATSSHGQQSAKSGTILDNQSTWIERTVTYARAGTIKFDWAVSSEASFDFLVFCIDSDSTCSRTVATTSISGQTATWSTVSYPIAPGTHTFRWMYAKDVSNGFGSDAGWIDNIRFQGSDQDFSLPPTVISTSAANGESPLSVMSNCATASAGYDLIVAGNQGNPRSFSVRCNGAVYTDSGYNTGNADLAEYFLAGSSTLPMAGDTVSLTPTATSTVVLSQASSRDLAVGVISAHAGFLGNSNEGRAATSVIVGLLGQIPTHVSAAGGAISAGDELMAGDNGVAVKARGPGMVIGRALDNLATGTGTIMVYVDPHWSAGSVMKADGSNVLFTNNLTIAATSTASAAQPLINSSMFSFEGSAWDASSSAPITSQFSLFNNMLSTTSSSFTLANASGTSLFSVSNSGNGSILGDLSVGKRLFLGSKTTGLTSGSYIYVDDTMAPTSTFIATNADGWQTNSTYDYAERYASNDDLVPGDLVTVDPTGVNKVKRTTSPNDTILGIVSTKPGFVTGAHATGTFPIALAGRVPTRVSTKNGAIQVGDHLMASDIPGVAIKATGAGNVVGVALESYSDLAEGLISVFVKPGWQGGVISDVGGSVTNVTVVSSASTITAPTSVRQGLAKIYAGANSVKVTFPTIQSYPLVNLQPYGQVVGGYWITNVTDYGFTIVLGQAPTFDLVFAWTVEPSTSGNTISFSDNTQTTYDSLTGNPIGPVLAPTSTVDTATSTTATTSTSSTTATASPTAPTDTATTTSTSTALPTTTTATTSTSTTASASTTTAATTTAPTAPSTTMASATTTTTP